MGILLANLPWTPLFPQGLNKISIVSQPLCSYIGTIYYIGTLLAWFTLGMPLCIQASQQWWPKLSSLAHIMFTVTWSSLLDTSHHTSLAEREASLDVIQITHALAALAPSGQLSMWKLPHGFYICSNKILTITVNIVSCENTAAERLAFSFNCTCNYNYTHNLEWSTCHCYSCLNYCYELMELPCLIRDGDCWKTEGREAVLNMTLVAIVPVHHLLQYFATHARLTCCHGNAFNMH